ncbi:MAG: helix-turn-helix domain-containing protein [Patescibacteria group bacterium]|nr:helix-turn-helix domain-containing protein [Patescibacteria group bacterium]
MSNQKQKWFINQLQDAIQFVGFKNLNITNNAHRLLLAIAKYADKNGYCWPLQSQLENDTGIREDNQSRYVRELKNKKFIYVKRKYERRTKMTRNYYSLNIDAILTISVGIEGDIRVDGIAVKQVKTEVERPCSNIEPTVNLTVRSKIDKPMNNSMETISYFDNSIKCSNIEPTVTMTGAIYKTTQAQQNQKQNQKQKPTKDFLYNVQNKALDDYDENNFPEVITMTNDVFFEEFWAAYPRKEKKKDCHKAWVKNNLDKIAEQIINDVRLRQIKHAPWLEGRSYIPLPTTYLNGERWHDDIINAQEINNKNEKFNSANYLVEKVKKDYENQGRNNANVFDVSNHLLKKMDR